jgi:non-ribosomal peptide synthetase component F
MEPFALDMTLDIASEIPLQDLLRRLDKDGIRLRVEGGQLRYSAPRGTVISELMPSLKQHKARLLEMLAAEPTLSHCDAVAPTAGADTNCVPLSIMQTGMVAVYPTLEVAHYLHPTVATVFEGALDLGALKASLRTLLARHSALRSRFATNDNGEPVTFIESEVRCDLRHMSIANHSDDAGLDGALAASVPQTEGQPHIGGNEAAQHFLARVVSERFDLSRAPLFRVGVATIAPDIHVLVVAAHHAILDGLSLDILLRELATLYLARMQGQSAQLEPVKLQFSDAILREREWLAGTQAQAAREYWAQRLKGVTSPFGLQPPATKSHKDGVVSHSHGPLRGSIQLDVTDKLRRMARAESTTFRSAALAAFAALLGRWRNSSEAFTWVCHPGRAHLELYQTVGCFYNLWMLRADLGADPTFVELLRQVRDAHLEALPWLELPFTEIGASLGNQTTNIIFSHLLVDSDIQSAGRSGPGYSSSSDRARAQALVESVPAVAHLEEVSRQTFSLACVERATEVTWGVLHAPSLVDCNTMAQMSRAYARILGSVAAEPGLRVSELPFKKN